LSPTDSRLFDSRSLAFARSASLGSTSPSSASSAFRSDTGSLFAGLFARFFFGECVSTPTVLVCFFVVVVARTPSAPPLSFSPSPSPGVGVSAGVFFLFFPIVVAFAFAVRVVLSFCRSVDHDDRTTTGPRSPGSRSRDARDAHASMRRH
jgi:hypothetical protein